MRTRHFFFLIAILAALFAGAAAADHSRGNVDELRFGDSVDASGEVPPNSSKDHFPPDVTIHVSMQVQEAPRGTPLLINILDRETEELVWSDEQDVPGGHTVAHFEIVAGDVPPGKYRARVKLGDDWVAEHEFQIEA